MKSQCEICKKHGNTAFENHLCDHGHEFEKKERLKMPKYNQTELRRLASTKWACQNDEDCLCNAHHGATSLEIQFNELALYTADLLDRLDDFASDI